ncbi:MAG: hypothetical protein ACI840_001950, partial [Ulvibacter sp.]
KKLPPDPRNWMMSLNCYQKNRPTNLIIEKLDV